jgi:hypothetical protein
MSPILLKDNEGEIRVITQGWEKPSEEQMNLQSLETHTVFVHEPCGGMPKVVKVSDFKKVLFCNKCGLRISFSHQVKTLGDMRKALSF